MRDITESDKIAALQVGDRIAYFNDDRCLNVAIVAFIHNDKSSQYSDRPVLNVCRIKEDGYTMRAKNVYPGHFDGIKWKILNRWMFLGEVPDDAQGHDYQES
jgi:hypothetical protein